MEKLNLVTSFETRGLIQNVEYIEITSKLERVERKER